MIIALIMTYPMAAILLLDLLIVALVIWWLK